MYPLLSKAKYDKQGHTVTLCFNLDMKPFFLYLKDNYTSYLLSDVHNFSRAYTIRIYELCKQYYPQIKERKIPLQRFKFLLNVEKKYSKWIDFKRSVIVPSLKEINDHSDIFVDFEPVKRGRSVSGVLFKISGNKNYKGGSVEAQDVLHEVVDSTPPNPIEPAYGLPGWISEAQYSILIKKFDKGLVRAGIEAVELKGDEVKSPRSYLMKGLKEGWFSGPSQAAASRAPQAHRDEERQAKDLQERIIREFDAKRNDFLGGLEVDEDSIELFIFEHEEAEDRFLRKMATQIARGERSGMAMNQVAVWMVNQDPEDYTEEEVILANSGIEEYALRFHGHRWVS